jgi:hypothetical protein
LEHPRFWVNQALPLAMVALAITGSWALAQGRAALYQGIILTLPIGAAAALATAAYLFPLSSRRFWFPGAVALLALEVLWVWSCQPRKLGRGAAIGAGLISAAVGAGAVAAQRASLPSSAPLGIAPPTVAAQLDPTRPPSRMELSPGWFVRPSDGTVLGAAGRLQLELSPLLWFESVSPDRCWTIFAPDRRSLGPNRALAGLQSEAGRMAAVYADPLEQTLVARAAENGLELEAFTQLGEPIYSHLNTFCELNVRGHRRLGLRFSPCPEAEIEVLPADYPTGRPARAAVLEADGTFRVVQARTGEKGPFTTLASGRLASGDPLTITLCDEGQPVAEVTLHDFAAQAARQLSPTAGWGLPVNAIEFARLGDTPESPVAIWVTLSGTSVGRGWDSVGHAAGIYRNRVTVRAIDQAVSR